VAIVTLSNRGDAVEGIQIVQTGANFIRGMATTPDGRYLGLVGQKGGEIEIYECKGERGEKIELVARSEGQVELGTDLVWV
jgi:6-phosphogluconolactonase (cycloisomerase 2 family)